MSSRSDEKEPLIAREGSRASSLDDEEAAEIRPTSTTEPEVDSGLLRRAGRILAFGVVATVIILLGLVGRFGVAAVTRVELGVPHEGIANGNVVRLPDGALAHRAVQSSSSADLDAMSPEKRAEVKRRDAARARRQSAREERRRRRQWTRDAHDASAANGGGVREGRNVASFGQASAARATGVAGVSLNGWLHLEDWFYSQDATSLVDTSEGMAQGVVFPPAFPTPESLGFKWASEGDLVARLVETAGEEATVAAFVAHRDSYFGADDLTALRARGYEHVRLPLTWAAFASEADEPERLITDPAHADKKQVTVSRAALDQYVAKLADAGLKIVIDMHTMPGGSSRGTYNGVFPSEPVFWDDPKLMTVGRGVVREMLRWYLALPERSRNAVGGVTLLNEPAHMLPEKSAAMLEWYAGVVGDYRALIVEPATKAGAPPPRLLVNFIDTCGMTVDDMGEWMARNFAADELRTWAVLDTHMYLAWEHPAPDAWSCDTPVDQIKSDILNYTTTRVGQMNDIARRNGIAHTAVSEWSIATNHDSKAGCQDTIVLEALREAQTTAFDQGGVESYFWGWKMPNAGGHQKFWSAEFHERALAAARAGGAASTGESEAAMPAEAKDGSIEGDATAVEMVEASTEAIDAAQRDDDVDRTEETVNRAEETVEGNIVDAAPSAKVSNVEPVEVVPSGYIAMSVDPAAQVRVDGSVAEMRAAQDVAEAEARAAADREAAAAALKRETAEARAAEASRVVEATVERSVSVSAEKFEETPVNADDGSLDALMEGAMESLDAASEPVDAAAEPVAAERREATVRAFQSRNRVARE